LLELPELSVDEEDPPNDVPPGGGAEPGGPLPSPLPLRLFAIRFSRLPQNPMRLSMPYDEAREAPRRDLSVTCATGKAAQPPMFIERRTGAT
jgi:hypothetical protein